MKKTVKRLLVLFLALTFIVTDLVAAPVTTQAAGALRFQKTITLMKNDQVGYGIINSVRSDQVVGLKSCFSCLSFLIISSLPISS